MHHHNKILLVIYIILCFLPNFNSLEALKYVDNNEKNKIDYISLAEFDEGIVNYKKVFLLALRYDNNLISIRDDGDNNNNKKESEIINHENFIKDDENLNVEEDYIINLDDNIKHTKTTSTDRGELFQDYKTGYQHWGYVYWGYLGMLYQERDRRWKLGGNFESLSSYDNAILLMESEEITKDGEKVWFAGSISSDIDNYFFLHYWTLCKGSILSYFGRYNESLSTYNHALDLSIMHAPNTTILNIDKATVLFAKASLLLNTMNEPDEAAILFKKVIELDPCHLEADYLYVLALQSSKNISTDTWKSITLLLIDRSNYIFNDYKSIKDIEISDNCKDINDQKLNSQLFTYNGIRERLQFIAESIDLNNDVGNIDITGIYWAISVAAEMSGDQNLSWHYLDIAQNIDLTTIPLEIKYNQSESIANKKHIISFFQKDFWPSTNAKWGINTLVPVFIVGFFRSGSTLLETMLSAHKNIFGIGEYSHFIVEMHILHDEMMKIALSSNDTQSNYKKFRNIVKKTGNQYLTKLSNLVNDSHVASPSISSSSSDITRVVDKMLGNYKNIALIHLLYPNAVIINTVRDPLDTLLSCYRSRFTNKNNHWTKNSSSLVLEYVHYLEIMQHFRNVLPTGRIIDVSYEALIADPESVMKRIIETELKLEWDSKVLDYHKFNRIVHTASVRQVKENIYSKSIGRWRKFSKVITPIKDEFIKYVPRLIAQGALPKARKSLKIYSKKNSEELIYHDKLYDIDMNWNLDENFDYKNMFNSLSPNEKDENENAFITSICPISSIINDLYLSIKHDNFTNLSYNIFHSRIDSCNVNVSWLFQFELMKDMEIQIKQELENEEFKSKELSIVKKMCYELIHGRLFYYLGWDNDSINSFEISLEYYNLFPNFYQNNQFYQLIQKFKADVLMLLPTRHAESIEIYYDLLNSTNQQLIFLKIYDCMELNSIHSNQNQWNKLIVQITDYLVIKSNSKMNNNTSISYMNKFLANNSNFKFAIDNIDLFWLIFFLNKKLVLLNSKSDNKDKNSLWMFLEKLHNIKMINNKLIKYENINEINSLEQTQYITDTYNQGFWPPREINGHDLKVKVGLDSDVPIFIVGFQQSGCGLLKSLLKLHGNVSIIRSNINSNSDIHKLQQDIHSLITIPHPSINQSPLFSLLLLQQVTNNYGNKVIKYMDNQLALEYIHNNKLITFNSNNNRISKVINQIISNYKYIALIHLVFPNAVILHMTRDPLDTLLSCYSYNSFNKDPSLSYTNEIKSLVKEFVLYLKIMQHFRNVLPTGRIIDVSYEALIADPESVMKRIIETELKLEWDSKVLEKPLHLTSIGKWKFFSDKLEPLKLELLKYLPHLKKEKSLPFARKGLKKSIKNIKKDNKYNVDMNWDLDDKFDYNNMIDLLK